MAWRKPVQRHTNIKLRHRYRCVNELEVQMAEATILVDPTASARRVARRVASRHVMLVKMMPEVLRSDAILMRAIRRHRCPGSLQRQKDQHKNEDQPIHRPNCS